MPSLFTRIIQGEIPCYKVTENDDFLAFLDINPLTVGHTLVIPKQEVDYYFDLPDETLANMTLFAKRVAEALKEEITCLRIGVIVAGLEVPHAHVHLVPMHSEGDLSFSKPRVEFSQEQFSELASKLSARLK